MSQTKVEMHAVVHGYVQGVWFRATTREHAEKIGVKGTVKNLADGTVEIYAQGSKARLEQFISNLKANPGMGTIDSIDIDYSQPKKTYSGFDIAY